MKNRNQAGRSGSTKGGAKQIPIEFPSAGAMVFVPSAEVHSGHSKAAKIPSHIGGWYELPKVQISARFLEEYKQMARNMGYSFSDFVEFAIREFAMRERMIMERKQKSRLRQLTQIPGNPLN